MKQLVLKKSNEYVCIRHTLPICRNFASVSKHSTKINVEFLQKI